MPINDRPFGNDRPLLYDVEPWNTLGFAVANFSRISSTKNQAIWRLADEIGKCQLLITTHIDAQRTQFPSMNTIMRMGKMINRIKAVLANRQKGPGDLRLEETHASAASNPWNIHPVPFFNSDFMQNTWISEYNRLTMIGLTNIYQHSDNNLALTITEAFATHAWAYFKEVAILLGTELLNLTAEAVTADGFQFDDAAYAGYDDIDDRVPSFEALDGPGPILATPDELDLKPFFIGIPANMIITSLAEFPTGPGNIARQGTEPSPDSGPPGADGAATGPAGGHIGEPQV